MSNLLPHQVYLGLGSNLGNRETIIREAIQLIGERVGTVVRQSSLIETEPWGFESENKFLNSVILVETAHSPREVLTLTQQIERNLGRKQKSQAVSDWTKADSTKSKGKNQKPKVHYADRPIDIDILLYDDLTIDDPDLKIPHPLMQQRDFVMIPLEEIKRNDK